MNGIRLWKAPPTHPIISMLMLSISLVNVISIWTQLKPIQCRELTWNSQLVRDKKKKKTTCQRRTITQTRQYLCDSAICLHPQSSRDFTIIKEKYKMRQYSISVSQRQQQHETLITKKRFYILCTRFNMWSIFYDV